jgi:hypothetical protein
MAKIEKLAMDKHSSLLQIFANYRQQSFTKLAPSNEIFHPYFIVVYIFNITETFHKQKVVLK